MIVLDANSSTVPHNKESSTTFKFSFRSSNKSSNVDEKLLPKTACSQLQMGVSSLNS
jgi:hypothetical protein